MINDEQFGKAVAKYLRDNDIKSCDCIDVGYVLERAGYDPVENDWTESFYDYIDSNSDILNWDYDTGEIDCKSAVNIGNNEFICFEYTNYAGSGIDFENITVYFAKPKIIKKTVYEFVD